MKQRGKILEKLFPAQNPSIFIGEETVFNCGNQLFQPVRSAKWITTVTDIYEKFFSKTR